VRSSPARNISRRRLSFRKAHHYLRKTLPYIFPGDLPHYSGSVAGPLTPGPGVRRLYRSLSKDGYAADSLPIHGQEVCDEDYRHGSDGRYRPEGA
jgi:hypothetical protein